MRLEKVINERIDKVLEDLVKEFNVKSGDTTPDQEQLIEDFKQMMCEWIIQNKAK